MDIDRIIRDIETPQDVVDNMAGCLYAFLPEAIGISRELILKIGFDNAAFNVYKRNLNNFDEVTSSVVITTLLMIIAQTDIEVEEIAERFGERDS